jgi:epoxyqueuosine reductase
VLACSPLMSEPEREISDALRAAGAALVGFADLAALPAEATRGYRHAVSIARALDPGVVAGLHHGPTLAYHAEYDRANAELARLAERAASMLHARGYDAHFGPATVRAVSPGADRNSLPHKTVATRAGLGWIGHSALLVTREYGPAVRLVSVLTDAPLRGALPVDQSRCGRCRRCAEACPAHAISGRPWSVGVPRESFYAVLACRETASRLAAAQGIDATICGICIAVCPFTRRYLRRVVA